MCQCSKNWLSVIELLQVTSYSCSNSDCRQQRIRCREWEKQLNICLHEHFFYIKGFYFACTWRKASSTLPWKNAKIAREAWKYWCGEAKQTCSNKQETATTANPPIFYSRVNNFMLHEASVYHACSQSVNSPNCLKWMLVLSPVSTFSVSFVHIKEISICHRNCWLSVTNQRSNGSTLS